MIANKRRDPDLATAQPYGEPQRIYMLERIIDCVRIRVQSTAYPYGVGLYVSADSRVVVASYVVGEVGFLVEVLSGEAHVALERSQARGVLIWWRVSERLLLIPLPRKLLLVVKDSARGVQIIQYAASVSPARSDRESPLAWMMNSLVQAMG